MTFVLTRRGVVDSTGTVLGQPDEGSVTRNRPCGTFRGERVLGFWRAVRLGFVSVEPRTVGLRPCECCYGWQGVELVWGENRE